MLRDLGTLRNDGTPYLRKAENDPSDSVFLVLLAEIVGEARSWQVGSAWLTLGEAQGAANRYAIEGHRAHHGWDYAVVMEYQTGQLAPQAQRHGDEYRPPAPVVVAQADHVAALELEVQRLRAQLGQVITAQ